MVEGKRLLTGEAILSEAAPVPRSQLRRTVSKLR